MAVDGAIYRLRFLSSSRRLLRFHRPDSRELKPVPKWLEGEKSSTKTAQQYSLILILNAEVK
ncbi:hypothetical protein RvY_16256 [Ramazzottius varieornatus]|uniref:Uncharacterized protein n=1 Tax=Ramazzottius varieornatus TaxID=947166 RepID=A0A1D1VXT2_RAMVA|nr:hypothetical protein RvY_16256 [Ramazzottius varieornatus]